MFPIFAFLILQNFLERRNCSNNNKDGTICDEIVIGVGRRIGRRKNFVQCQRRD